MIFDRCYKLLSKLNILTMLSIQLLEIYCVFTKGNRFKLGL